MKGPWKGASTNMERMSGDRHCAVGDRDMPSVNEYAALAAMHIERAQSIEGAAKAEQLRLALSYLRLAEMAQTITLRRQQQQIQQLQNGEN